MSRQPDRGRQGDPPADAAAEVAAARSAIARTLKQLRRLRRLHAVDQRMLHPELRELAQEIAAWHEHDTPNPGRHRASTAPDGRDGQQASAPGSLGHKPDPATARTARELNDLLTRYKEWSGDLSWRAVAARAGQKRVASTICEATKRDALPTRGVIETIITGCGGSQDDLNAFLAAWQRISATSTRARRTNPARSRPPSQRPSSRQATRPGGPARRPPR